MSSSPLEATRSRLGIVHLLAWTAGIAVVLAVFNWARQIDSRLAPSAMQQVSHFAYGLCYGAGICGAVLFTIRRIRQGAAERPSQPGHWMLVLLGCAGLIDGTVLLGGALLKQQFVWFEGGAGLYWIWIGQIASAQIAAAISIEVAINGSGAATRAWRRFALCLAIVLAVHSAMLFKQWVIYNTWSMSSWAEATLLYLPVIGIPLMMVLLALAMRDDRQQRRERDWLHFAGLGAIVLLACTHLAGHVWSKWLSA